MLPEIKILFFYLLFILMLIGIFNPDALNIRILNPIIALQMLIFCAA